MDEQVAVKVGGRPVAVFYVLVAVDDQLGPGLTNAEGGDHASVSCASTASSFV